MIKSVKIVTFIILLNITLFFFCLAQDEVIITTYYPSPAGSYNDLLVTGRQSIGDVNRDGSVNRADLPASQGQLNLSGGMAVNTNVLGNYTGQGLSQQTRLDVNGNIALNNIWLKDYNVWASDGLSGCSWITGSVGAAGEQTLTCPAETYLAEINGYSYSSNCGRLIGARILCCPY